MTPPAAAPARSARHPRTARVVLLAGPSGSGKSRLAARLHKAYDWPIVRLDDFYRDADDPLLPRSAALGIVDWDDPASWDEAAAVKALETLVLSGRATIPVYDIGASAAVGTAQVHAEPGDLVLAEGIFAAELVRPLRERGLLHAAYVIHQRPTVTFVRRLVRDLKERRKPPRVLVRRGWALMRVEPAVVAQQVALGAEPRSQQGVLDALASVAGASRHERSGPEPDRQTVTG